MEVGMKDDLGSSLRGPAHRLRIAPALVADGDAERHVGQEDAEDEGRAGDVGALSGEEFAHRVDMGGIFCLFRAGQRPVRLRHATLALEYPPVFVRPSAAWR